VPLLIQLPAIVWVNETALNVVDGAMVSALFTVIAAPAVFVPPLDSIRLL